MRPKGSSFFDGYQAEETQDGKRKKRLVYRGEYYGFPGGPAEGRRVKVTCTLLIVLSAGLNLCNQFYPSYGGMDRCVAIPSLLSLIPMIFLMIGLINLLITKDKWEIRMVYAGHRRLRRSGACYFVIMLIWLTMEALFVLRNTSVAFAEMRYIVILALSTCADAGLLFVLQRHPAVVVQGPEVQ